MKYKLGELCDVVSGGTPSRAITEFWEGGTIPWIKIGNIKGKYVGEADEYITQAGLEGSSAKILSAGTILFTIFATLGEVGILTIKACTNQAIAGITIKNQSEALTDYLYYFLKSKKSHVTALGRGVAQNNINLSILRNFEVPIPALSTQKQIVDVLDKAEKIIEARQQQLQKLDELVKARFVEMFGEPIQNPMNWPVVRLKEVSTLITNGNTPKGGGENYIDSGIIFLRSQNVWRNRIDLDDVAYIDEATHRSLKKSSLRYKDILITKTGRINTENSSLGRAALFLGEDNTANINGHVYLIRLDGSIVPEFVVTILTGEAYRKYIRKVCVGGIDKRQINVDQVEDFPIIVPPYEIQKDFAEFRGQVDKSKVAVQKALDEAQLLFDSLMQKYFQ